MSKFCTNCGKEMDSNSTVCLNCGVLQENNASNKQNNKKKKGLPVWAIVLIVVGSILLLPILILLLTIIFSYNIFSSTSNKVVQEQKKPELVVEVIHNTEFKFENVDYDYVDVKITGDDEKVKKVYSVKGIIDLNDIDNPKNGVNIIETYLRAYDISENEMDVNLNPSKIYVKVTLSGVVTEDMQTKEIEDVQVEARGLGANLKASTIEPNSSSVSVLIEGTKDELEDINEEDITAYVDLTGLGVGEHEVTVQVTGENENVQYTSKTSKIKIRISES